MSQNSPSPLHSWWSARTRSPTVKGQGGHGHLMENGLLGLLYFIQMRRLGLPEVSSDWSLSPWVQLVDQAGNLFHGP